MPILNGALIKNATSIITALAAAGALMVSVYTTFKVKEVHVMMNSRLTELLAITRAASKAEGVKEEQDKSK